MKIIKICLMSLAGLLSLFSCRSDDVTPALTHIESSIMDNIPFQNIVLQEPENNTNPLLFTATWTETQFHLDGSDRPTPAGPVSYTLQIDRAGNQFASAQPLAVTTSLSANVFVIALNDLLLSKFAATAGETISTELRVVATYGENVGDSIASGNTIPLSITPYIAQGKMQALYIIGDMNGWNNTNTDFMMFRENSDPENGIYTYTGRIAAGTYFKFCPEESLGTNKMYCRNDDQTLTYEERADGAFYSDKDSYKTITLNIKDMTYSITEYDASQAVVWPMLNFVGSFCDFGANNSDPEMVRSAYDPHIWSLSLKIDLVGYGVKFRASHSWDNRWAPVTPTDNPYCISLHNNPADNNIDIGKQGEGNYYVKFNDLTGHYIVMLQK